MHVRVLPNAFVQCHRTCLNFLEKLISKMMQDRGIDAVYGN